MGGWMMWREGRGRKEKERRMRIEEDGGPAEGKIALRKGLLRASCGCFSYFQYS